MIQTVSLLLIYVLCIVKLDSGSVALQIALNLCLELEAYECGFCLF
jgi:hypothetical protein